MSAYLDRVLQARDKAKPNRVSGVLVDIVGKNCKLIAAEPCQEISWPGNRPKALGDYLQNPITQGVTVEIVDTLEAIEVYQKECILQAIRRR
jgi:hypothetical protein